MRDDTRRPGRVEDYTDAFLGTLWAIMFVGFWVLSSVLGLLATVIVALVLNRAITHLDRWRNQRPDIT